MYLLVLVVHTRTYTLPSVSKDKQECCVMFSTTLSFLQTAEEKKPQTQPRCSISHAGGDEQTMDACCPHAPPQPGDIAQSPHAGKNNPARGATWRHRRDAQLTAEVPRRAERHKDSSSFSLKRRRHPKAPAESESSASEVNFFFFLSISSYQDDSTAPGAGTHTHTQADSLAPLD